MIRTGGISYPLGARLGVEQQTTSSDTCETHGLPSSIPGQRAPFLSCHAGFAKIPSIWRLGFLRWAATSLLSWFASLTGACFFHLNASFSFHLSAVHLQTSIPNSPHPPIPPHLHLTVGYYRSGFVRVFLIWRKTLAKQKTAHT